MRKLFKEAILRAVRLCGYDVTKRQEQLYSIFVEDRATIAEVTHQEHILKFFIGNPADHIQKTHMQGDLYELEELSIIQQYYDPETVFIDIGANVGNHAIWAAKCLGARRVIAFEPVLGQHTLLCANVALNGCDEIIEVRKVALSVSTGTARVARSFIINDNSGFARLSSTGFGEEVKLTTGDIELTDIGPHFIKIDVEGHEMAALEGLQKTIETHRPLLFIEVDNTNAAAFDHWLAKNHYEKRDEFKRHKENCNYIAAPLSQDSETA